MHILRSFSSKIIVNKLNNKGFMVDKGLQLRASYSSELKSDKNENVEVETHRCNVSWYTDSLKKSHVYLTIGGGSDYYGEINLHIFKNDFIKVRAFFESILDMKSGIYSKDFLGLKTEVVDDDRIGIYIQDTVLITGILLDKLFVPHIVEFFNLHSPTHELR